MHETLAKDEPELIKQMGLDIDTPTSRECKGVPLKDLATHNVEVNIVGDKNTEKEFEEEMNKVIKEENEKLDIYSMRSSGLAACGVMGNIYAESGFNTRLSGDQGSGGICQWRGGRLTSLLSYSASKKLAPDSIEAQAGFLVEQDLISQLQGSFVEYNGKKMNAYEALMNCTDVEDATDIVQIAFERGARFETYEGYLNSRYSKEGHYIAWNRFAHSSIKLYSHGKAREYYLIDEVKRRKAAKSFYDKYHHT